MKLKKDTITGALLQIDFVNRIFLVYFTLFSFEHVLATIQVFSKIWENLKKTFVPEFFFLIKLHMIKPATLLKRNRCFTVNFEKLLKAFCRTPTVSASNFNSTFLTFKMDIFNRKMDIYVFHLTRLVEATSKSIWFYIILNFESSKLFLMY